MFREYINYIKDNPKGYWFKRKPFGWGWTPARWQGWAVILVFIALISLNAVRIDSASHSVSDTLINFIPQTFILVLILIAICWAKGESPRWQWGWPKKDNKDQHS